MYGTRILTPALMGLIHQPQIVVQQAGPHADLHYMNVGDKQLFHPELRVTGELLVNQKFRELLGKASDTTSFRASDCTLTETKHADFAKGLTHVQAVELARGKITNIALNALIANFPNLRVLSLQGLDVRSGPAEKCIFEHPLDETPAPLPALQGKHLGLFDLQGYSSASGILAFVTGTIIDRLVVSASLMNLGQLDATLSESTVGELEFVSSGYESMTVMESMTDLANLNKLPIRLLDQQVDQGRLDHLTGKLGNQITVLSISNSQTLEAKDLDLVAERCPKLGALALFNCDGMSSEKDPLPQVVVDGLEKVVKATPVEHVVLGWDNDNGAPRYDNGPDPRQLINSNDLQQRLSLAAERPVKVTVTNWYPSSKLLDERA